MRLCWENLEGVFISSHGDFRKGSYTYTYKDECFNCGDPYLTNKYKNSKFCLNACAQTGKIQSSESCRKKSLRNKRYYKSTKEATSREVSSFVRKLVFEKDNWVCQMCNSKDNLHCHHIKSYSNNKILANDLDNCITLCKNCHMKVHSKQGCRFIDLHCKGD